MNLHDRRQWLRQHAGRLAFGALALLSGSNAALANAHAERAVKRLHDIELAQRNQNPTAQIERQNDRPVASAPQAAMTDSQLRAAAAERAERARETAHTMRHRDDEGKEAMNRELPNVDRRRPRARQRRRR